MYDITQFGQNEINECGTALRGMGAGGGSMEETANKIVRHLYDNLNDGSQKSCALVRFYKTHPYGQLDAGLQEFAQGVLGSKPADDVNCLTLLATAGDKPEWNSRASSQGHRAIPLASAEMVAGIPMISRLLSQFGLDVSSVMRSDAANASALTSKEFDTFYVAEAVGSPYIPAQDEFVVAAGVKSVLAFGGVLGSGELFVVIMFSKTPIPQSTADAIKGLAAHVKAAVQPFAASAVFA